MRLRLGAGAVFALTVLLAGCGLQPSGVEEGPAAPTGVAPGVTLYFLDEQGDLVPQQRDTGRLGSVSGAVSLLLTGPGTSGLTSGIDETTVTRNEVTINGDELNVRVPLSSRQVSDAGLDQIVCTTLASHIQSGNAAHSRVRVRFTDGDSNRLSCPVLG